MAIPSDVAKQIANCELYTSATSCKLCKTGYFLEATGSTKCSQVTKTITNCDYYGTATTCFACKDGYHLSDDNLTCTQIKNDCLTYTEYKCDSCATDYVKDKTVYQEGLYKYNSND